MSENRWIRRRRANERSDMDVEAQLIAVHDGHVLYRARWPRARVQNRATLKPEIIYNVSVLRMPWRYWAQRYAGAVG